MTETTKCKLILEDGSIFHGNPFGFLKSTAGEVVFNTGMVGYPETLTDPSYRGQILVLTYPLIGNYGIPESDKRSGIDYAFESDKVQISGLIVSEAIGSHNHWNSEKSLGRWLYEHEVPGFEGVDTRALTKRLRESGSMLGKLGINGNDEIDFYDPNEDMLLPQVSVQKPIIYRKGKKSVIVIDCGCKNNIIRVLLSFNLTVIRVPWDYDFSDEKFDGVVISNGPGDPQKCLKTVIHIQRAFEKEKPILGICLGNQILALAAGADTYKLKFGHRSQNQPCIRMGSNRCYITSQNHGFAVDNRSLPQNWEPWFINANDGTNEGIRHISKPFFGVQFHPEASPGPVDTHFIFEKFVNKL
jgi:carbamoyl-phosphate synthase small subunit